MSYTGKATLWSSILSLADFTLLTAATLYYGGLHRLADGQAWFLAELVRLRASLARTVIGTVATITGSVDLGTLVYDPITGDLNGLTIVMQSDNSASIVVTFGIGAGVAPTGPADVVTAILASTGGNPAAVLDSAGHLNLSSTTSGGTGTIGILGGTALALLGFGPLQTGTGQSTGGDGASRIGQAAITGASFNIIAGTMRAVSQYLADHVASLTAPLDAVKIPLVAVTRSIEDVPLGSLSASWSFSTDGDLISLDATGSPLVYPLDLPHGQSLTGVSVTILPAGSHAGLPQFPPQVLLVVKTIATNAVSTIAFKVDPSANPAAYEAIHAVTTPLIGHTIDRTANRYYMRFTGENGTSALAGAKILGATYTVNATSIPL